MKQILIVAIPLGALAIASCSSSGPLVTNEPVHELPGEFPNHTAEQIIDSLRTSMGQIYSYSTDGSIEISASGASNSGGLSLRSRVGDSLSAVVRGPLGIVAGRALFTPDSVFFADRINDNDYAGPASQSPPVPPPFDAFFRMNGVALGQTPLGLLSLDEQDAWDVATDSLHYVMTRSASPEERETAIIDPAIWRITSYRLTGQDGKETHVRISFMDFDTVDGFVVPRSVTINDPYKETTLHLEHKRIRINPADLTIGNRPTAPTTSRSQ